MLRPRIPHGDEGLLFKAHRLCVSLNSRLEINKKKGQGEGVGRGGGDRGGGLGEGDTSAGSYSRLIDSCITQLKAQGPSRTCNESKEEEEDTSMLKRMPAAGALPPPPPPAPSPGSTESHATLIRTPFLGPYSSPMPRDLW